MAESCRVGIGQSELPSWGWGEGEQQEDIREREKVHVGFQVGRELSLKS